MTTIVTRAGKGSPLTHTEVDTNFTNLNTAKLETAAIPLGTLQAPSVSFLNDSDTGIFCPQGGNSLAIATGAQYAITCTSTQAVGIKTANPQKALHVAGATRVGADDATDAFLEIGEGATGDRNSYIDIVGDTTYTDYGLRVIRNNGGADATSEIKHRGTGAFNIVTQEAAPIQFYTTNSPRLTITSGGNVGIGTSTFATNSKFAVQTGAGKLDICGDGASSVKIINGGGITFDSASGHYFHNGATELMRITAAGLVGIGSTGPLNQLTVKAANNDGIALTRPSNATINHLLISTTETGGDQYRTKFDTLNNDFILNTYVSGGSGGNIRFRTGTAIDPTDKVIIDSSGRLLVGTITGNANGGILQLTSGITFPATAVAASDANTLDDYEEGTWTPVLADAATGGNVAASYTAREGIYTKIGRSVSVTCKIVFPVTTGMTAGNEIFVRGLPFSAAQQSFGSIFLRGITFPAGYTFAQSFLHQEQSSTVQFPAFGSAVSEVYLTVASISSGSGLLYFAFTYNV